MMEVFIPGKLHTLQIGLLVFFPPGELVYQHRAKLCKQGSINYKALCLNQH